ncbi:alkaline phosphatase family protein [Aeropyrum camini]|uniref:alkaline phosphatase family protein n=1 Tax=Aeropyrum camini TaxID=229980 RepID=UPI00210AE368|nr:alkaline phosphatase family protein [Aeropyrum camini]
MTRKRLLVLGLDSVPPQLLYEDLRDLTSNLQLFLDIKGILLSNYPPITVPMWGVMLTGRSAGELGVYGFRHRRPGDVGVSYVVSSRSIPGGWVWDVLGGRLGLRSLVVGVPPGYPARRVRGWFVSCFLTPGVDRAFAWPPGIRGEVLAAGGGDYVFDVKYRSGDKEGVRRGLWRLAETQFRVVRHLLRSKPWDFAMYMHIGTDRVHHAFWKYWDPEHPRYPGEGNPYEDVIPEYYALVDRLVGELLEELPRDTEVIVVSDHGAKAMKGAFAINQWLVEQGYLKLREQPRKPGVDLEWSMIDWSRTVAWAWGGYYSRVYINLKGREPQGIVGREEYWSVVEQLKRDIEKIRGPDGEKWNNKAYHPTELYPEVRGDAPDLMVYLDNLSWRPAGTIGWPSIYLEENDRGPDDAVHDWLGIIGGNAEVLKDFVKGGGWCRFRRLRVSY